MSETPTPRTDAELVSDPFHEWVMSSFARTLERELSAADERTKKAEAECDALRADAERYRWLRQRYQALTAMQAARGIGLDLSHTFVNTAEKFDGVVDAARAIERKITGGHDE